MVSPQPLTAALDIFNSRAKFAAVPNMATASDLVMDQVKHTLRHPSSIPNLAYKTMLSMATIAERLKLVIDARSDVSAADVSRHIGISKAAMSDILSGKTKQPKPENLLKIADYLGLEIRWIISGEGLKTREESRRQRIDISHLSEPHQALIQTLVDTVEQPEAPESSNSNSHRH